MCMPAHMDIYAYNIEIDLLIFYFDFLHAFSREIDIKFSLLFLSGFVIELILAS